MIKQWKPKCGENFYYITFSGTVAVMRANRGKGTIFRIATGNCFKSYSQANKYLKKLLDDLNLPRRSWGKPELFIAHPDLEIPEKYVPYAIS